MARSPLADMAFGGITGSGWRPDPGTLLGIVPMGGGTRLAIVGYVLPPADDSAPPTGRPADGLTGPPADGLTGRPANGLVVDAAQRRALVNGQDVGLVFREFELLAFLTARPGRAFTRAHLLASVWDEGYQGSSRTVDVHMHRLRRKLGPEHGQCLVTMRRLGYLYRPPAPGVLPADHSLEWAARNPRATPAH